MTLLKLGDKIINTDAITYVDTKGRGTSGACVIVCFTASNGYFDNNYGRMEREMLEFPLQSPEAEALIRWFSDEQNVTVLIPS